MIMINDPNCIYGNGLFEWAKRNWNCEWKHQISLALNKTARWTSNQALSLISPNKKKKRKELWVLNELI